MNIVVCIKIMKESLPSCRTWFSTNISTCDIYALALGLQLSKSYGVNVQVISMGPLNTKKMLTDLYVLGVDHVYLVSDNAFAGSDTLATSYILSKALKTIPHDMILCGDHTDDSATGQVSIQLANHLQYNFIRDINNIEIAEEGVKAKQNNTILHVPYPLVITVKNRVTVPFPSLHTIEKSKVKEVSILDQKDIHADSRRCGILGSPTKLRQLDSYNMENSKRKQDVLSNTIEENTHRLMQIINHSMRTDY